MIEKRRFERINNMKECKSCIKNEDISENKKNIIYGFNHAKTEKIDKYIFFGCK